MRQLTISIFALCMILTSCKNPETSSSTSTSASSSSKASSSGGAREIVVSVDSDLYNDQTRKLIEEYFSPEMYGMPQLEQQTKLYIIPSTNFTNTYQRHRNVLVIDKADSTSSFTEVKNVFSAPQTIVEIKVTDWNNMNEMFQKYHSQILDTFHDGDINFLQNKFTKISHRNTPKLLSTLGIEMNIPNYFRPVMANSDFVWLLKDVKKGKNLGTVNIIVYRYKDLTGEMIDPISLRDSITKKSVIGELANSYMNVEKAALYPLSENIEIQSMFAVETRGLWRTEGDFMGGPFINYTIYDDKTDTVYGADGFVYFPSQDKAHYIFELEAILKTFKLVGRDSPEDLQKK